ncbi:hypothetical protein QAD02_012218 [Eretmocerus hayati]|uniref:Uncharacterized protein n=1 Tax=Eretmocerus hayati TaxID=131215 RepID=A0ACC2NZ44_9HYME|nr:hypothetical protein QAD02_012218 [Eretmocerus hayati]
MVKEDDYDHTRGCEQLTCKADEHCMQRRFPCGDAKCPFMFYCFRSKRESLLGLESCASVLCSPGYKCLVDVRDCHWDQQCQQKRAMCVSEREFHEVPASCEEVTCPMNYRCILREAHCQHSPCKLVKSCAPNKEVHKWFHECRQLGCRSEHDCFLRKSKDCMMPPCDYVPDCLNNINPNGTNDSCRGWICPPNQICTASTNGPCSRPSECRVSRICHHGTSLGSATPPWQFTEVSFDHVNCGLTFIHKPLDLAARKTTLADLEEEILLEERRRMALSFGPSLHSNKTSPPGGSSTKGSTNPTLIARTHEGQAEYVPMESKRAPSVQNMRRASFDDSGWLAYLKRNVGSEAVEYWISKAKANENHQGFVKWLKSVEALLDPAIYQRWICEIAGFPEFHSWLLPLNLQLQCFPTNHHSPVQPNKGDALRSLYDDVSSDDLEYFPESMTQPNKVFFNPKFPEKSKPSWASSYPRGSYAFGAPQQTSAEKAFMRTKNFTIMGNSQVPKTPNVDLKNYQRFYPADENSDPRNTQPTWRNPDKNEQASMSKRYEPIIYINRGRYSGSSDEVKYRGEDVNPMAQGYHDSQFSDNAQTEKQGTRYGFLGSKDLGPRQASQLKPNFVKFVTNQTSVSKASTEGENHDQQPNLLIYFPPPLSLVMYYSVKENTDSSENASRAEESQIVPKVHDPDQSGIEGEWDEKNFTSIVDADDNSEVSERSKELSDHKEYSYIRKIIKELIQYWDDKETSVENRRGILDSKAGSTASRPEKSKGYENFRTGVTNMKPPDDENAKSMFNAFLKWFDQNGTKNVTLMDVISQRPDLSSSNEGKSFTRPYGNNKNESMEVSLENAASKKIQFFVGVDKNPEIIEDLISKYKGKTANNSNAHKDQIVLNLKDFVDPKEEELIFHKLINIAVNNSNENLKKDEKMPKMLWVFPIYENDDERLLSKLEQISHEKNFTFKNNEMPENHAEASSRILKQIPTVKSTTQPTVKPTPRIITVLCTYLFIIDASAKPSFTDITMPKMNRESLKHVLVSSPTGM